MYFFHIPLADRAASAKFLVNARNLTIKTMHLRNIYIWCEALSDEYTAM